MQKFAIFYRKDRDELDRSANRGLRFVGGKISRATKSQSVS